MWYLVPVVGIGGIILAVMVLRLLDMWLSHEIGGGEFLLVAGLLGWVGTYSWAKWPSPSSIFLLGSVGLVYGGLRMGERRLRVRTARQPLERAARSVDGLKAALKKNPKNSHLKITLGDAFTALGLVDEALSEYEAAALLAPDSSEILRKRQEAESRRLRMLNEGVLFCPLCALPNPKGNKFCNRCGRALPQLSNRSQR